MRSERKDEKGCTLATFDRQYKGVVPFDPVNKDLSAVLDIAIKTLRGRKVTYEANTEGLQAFINKSLEYLEYVKQVNEDPEVEHKLIADVEGWCVYCGITRTTIATYSRRDGDWQRFIELFREAIASFKKQAALSYRTPQMIAVFDLANNHGYKNTSEFKLSSDNNQDEAEQERQRTLEAQLVKALSEGEGAAGDNLDLPQLDF